ncbi:MAG: L-2-hydroxyglutarate oxidase [Phycisphaerae bacterium]|nr:L-2-hydroxyglutarate oxidase [Phycisphaerae bacterium]
MTTRIVIIGAVIIGLATARSVARRLPDARITILEKADRIAAHQSGHNSGVLHSGIYYTPGSMRARTCRTGLQLMESYCDEHGIPWKRCGKVIVATREEEIPRLEKLHQRGLDNGVDCHRITPEELKEYEPHVHGVAALHVPSTGVVDYVGVCKSLAESHRQHGELLLNQRVTAIQTNQSHATVKTHDESIDADLVIVCGGLHADRIARRAGASPPVRILPFRGEYWKLKPEAAALVRGLIYPVPDPAMPFLGVHFTRTIHDEVEAGPSAVPALSREGYRWRDVNLVDTAQALLSLRSWKLAARWWKNGASEIHRSLSRNQALRSMRHLLPGLKAGDIERAPAGVRAQAVDVGGNLVDDFLIEAEGPVVHVLNAPSPAATASLAIADLITDRALEQLESC